MRVKEPGVRELCCRLTWCDSDVIAPSIFIIVLVLSSVSAIMELKLAYEMIVNANSDSHYVFNLC